MNFGPPVVVLVGAAMLAIMVFRLGPGPGGRKPVALVAAVALGARVLTVIVVYLIAIRTHGEGTWLNDEASYFLSTEALMPNPFQRALPSGLDHLNGNAYLGVTTTLSKLAGSVDSTVLRMANAVQGAVVAVLVMLIARRIFGARAGLVAGLIAALWPNLMLWSATMLRDTLGSVAVVVTWWTLTRSRTLFSARTLSVVALALLLTLNLRAYLAGTILCGVIAWAAFPHLRRINVRHAAFAAGALACIALVVGVTQARQIDFLAHELLYRQTTTRMELLGKLYTGIPVRDRSAEFKPGTAVATVDSGSGWLHPGLVREPAPDGQLIVDFTDGSTREVPPDQLQVLQSTRIPPLQLFQWITPNLFSFVTGIDPIDATPNVWVPASLLFDLLLVVALVGVWRCKPPLRELMYPACVVGGTLIVLLGVPGAPGNDDRHRSTQAAPLLIVFAAGLLSSEPRRALTWSRPAVSGAISRPASAAAPAISRSLNDS
ncbi:MAG: glycosyltransferase family 39 protein [Chloroflexi bacterium]|nr:glycosyltransferase family 39 protein [Chloroflexota bacterium]